MSNDRYIRYPLLHRAIIAHRQARISHAVDPSPITAARVTQARKAERKARAEHADRIRNDKIAARVTAIRAKRYHYQHSRKSRTSDQARELRTSRAARRHAAALANERKRIVNAINAPFMVSTDAQRQILPSHSAAARQSRAHCRK